MRILTEILFMIYVGTAIMGIFALALGTSSCLARWMAAAGSFILRWSGAVLLLPFLLICLTIFPSLVGVAILVDVAKSNGIEPKM